MKVGKFNVLVGADPEVFLTDSEGQLVSAVGKVMGTKEEPHPVKDGAVQLDGMAAEFNIDPAKNKAEFVKNLRSVMRQLDVIVGKEHSLAAIPTAHFGAEYIAAQPESARELGCEPDYNAYTGQENPTPNAETPFRTGAGHVHVGWTEVKDPYSESHLRDCRTLAIYMDTFLALGSMLFDQDQERRQLYGNAGAFRPKTYGMEYRTLSNAWLQDPRLMAWVHEQTIAAFKAARTGKRFERNVDWYLTKAVDWFNSAGQSINDHLLEVLEEYGVNPPPVVGEPVNV